MGTKNQSSDLRLWSGSDERENSPHVASWLSATVRPMANYVGFTSSSRNSDAEFPLLIARDQVARLRFLLTARLRVSPALNLAWVLARILIASPVCGLRPLRAARSATLNLPKPDSRTSSPLARWSVMVVKTAVTARSA